MRDLLSVLFFAVFLGMGSVASALVFNDGQLHVITTVVSEDILVRNAGCPANNSSCPSPGAATTLRIDSGANVRDIDVRDTSMIEFRTGSSSDEIELHDQSEGLVEGGEFRDDLQTEDTAFLAIVGTGFKLNGQAIPEGDLPPGTRATLTGRLVMGDLIDTTVDNVNGGTIRLVPEPEAGLARVAALFVLAVLRIKRH